MVTQLLLAATLLSADTTYFVGFLRTDPGRKKLASKEEGERIQAAHMANIHKMADAGQLLAAGPFDDTPHSISGIFVLKASSIEVARQIAAADPTVIEHRNTIDVHTWHGPAGIGEEYFRLHKADPKIPEGMGVHPLFLMQPGPSWDSPERAETLHAHQAYWDRLTAKLGAIGPVDSTDLKGIIVFKRIPFDEAQALIESDPAVIARVLRAEGHHWWCAEHVLPAEPGYHVPRK